LTPKNRKQKGRRLQHYVGALIAEALGLRFGKDQDVESRPMGQSGTDVIIRPPHFERLPYAIECKNTEKWTVPQYIEQAEGYATAQKHLFKGWLLFLKKNNSKVYVVMDEDTFVDLLKKRHDHK